MSNPIWDSLSKEKQAELEALQLLREDNMLEQGVSRYWKTNEDSGKPEEAFIREAGLYLYPAIEAVRQDVVERYLDEDADRRQLPAWAPVFMWLSNEHILVVLLSSLCPAARSIKELSKVPMKSGVRPWDMLQQGAARNIATTIWQLSQYHEARGTHEEQWEKQSHYIKNWDARNRLRFTKKVLDPNNISKQAKLSLGIKLLEIATLAGVTNRKVTQDGKRQAVLYGLSDDIIKELHNRHADLQWLRPKWEAMISPPNDYVKNEDGRWEGGYYSPLLERSLVRPTTPGHGHMPVTEVGDITVEAVNATQQTAFGVNTFILENMKTVFEQNLRLGDAPVYQLDEHQFARFEGEERKEDGNLTDEFRTHIRRMEAAHSQWFKEEADRLRMISRLSVGTELSQVPAYWLPITLDFRTRQYTSTEMLSPQGCDFDKALCMFAERKRQTERGREWTKIHIANNFGIDKVSFQERIDWVDEHEAELRASAEDPISNKFWTTADDKHQWQALAAAHDLYVDPEYTTVPVQMDGSCNGIQHWSAIGRDSIGAEATNLVDSSIPNDLYGEVAVELVDVLETNASDWGERWIEKVTRSLAKRPCMTYPYGVTRRGIQRALKADGLCDWLFETDDVEEGSAFITRMLMVAIPNVVRSSHYYMQWIKKVAAAANKTDGVIRWVTPAGSVVDQGYYELNNVAIRVEDKRIQFAVPSDEPVVSRKKALAGIAPNFIHSMDASHMQLTTVDMKDEGVDYFSMIHDSFGCHACDVDIMQACIRRQFVAMYTESDPIVDFANRIEEEFNIGLPEMPDRGDFDINQVLTARYFFS